MSFSSVAEKSLTPMETNPNETAPFQIARIVRSLRRAAWTPAYQHRIFGASVSDRIRCVPGLRVEHVSVPRPMLATTGELPVVAGWAYEFKWDGVRAMTVAAKGGMHLYARSGAEITMAYPELGGLGSALAEAGVTDAVLDGEIVILDEAGHPSFTTLAERMHVRDIHRTRQLAATRPVNYMIFDVLRANGTDVCPVPYTERREWL